MRSEYCHFGNVAAGCATDAWGAGPFILRDRGREWSFEFSDRFGPVVLIKDEEPAARQPTSPRNPFWRPFNAWLAQGKQVEDGVAVWREPLPVVLWHLAGRHYVLEDEGEDGGETITLPATPTEDHP